MSFDLRNAASTFQRFIDEVVRGLNFVDGVASEENLVKHLSQLFERLSAHHVRINADKCMFGQNSLEFLGHLINSNGSQPLSKKVEAIQQISPPTSLRQLRQFLRMVNFYRRFIPNYADKLLPLTVLLKTQKKKMPK